MTIQIEKNIPIPEKLKRHRSPKPSHKYPLRIMEKGDSFVQPLGIETNKYPEILYATLSTLCRRLSPKKFKIQVLEDNQGVRVWRTE